MSRHSHSGAGGLAPSISTTLRLWRQHVSICHTRCALYLCLMALHLAWFCCRGGWGWAPACATRLSHRPALRRTGTGRDAGRMVVLMNGTNWAGAWGVFVCLAPGQQATGGRPALSLYLSMDDWTWRMGTTRHRCSRLPHADDNNSCHSALLFTYARLPGTPPPPSRRVCKHLPPIHFTTPTHRRSTVPDM